MRPEAAVQNAIRLWCGERGIPCFRCNVGRVKTEDGRWFDTGLPEGFPDLLLILGGGKVAFVEVKSAIGRQRPGQKDFQAMAESLGHIYVLARSEQDVEKALLSKNIEF